jgi:molybdopterin converting factor small subunit
MKMIIHLKLYATLRKYLPGVPLGESVPFEIPDEGRVEDILNKLHISTENAKVVFVNGIHQDLKDPLHAEDLVVIFPPIGGG